MLITMMNLVFSGGTYAEAGAPTSTHLVVDEHNVKNIPFETHHKLHVVKTEVRSENKYIFNNY